MFTILFGSQATKNQTPLSDTDIAVYTDEELSYLDQGNLILEFEQQYKTKVDLVILNDIMDTEPSLAYNVMFHGKLIQCDDDEQYKLIKYKVLQHYLDTTELRERFLREFEKRVLNKGREDHDSGN